MISRVPGWLSHLSIQLLILALGMISWLVRSSPTSGSALAVGSLLGILPLSFSKVMFKRRFFKKISFYCNFYTKNTIILSPCLLGNSHN